MNLYNNILYDIYKYNLKVNSHMIDNCILYCGYVTRWLLVVEWLHNYETPSFYVVQQCNGGFVWYFLLNSSVPSSSHNLCSPLNFFSFWVLGIGGIVDMCRKFLSRIILWENWPGHTFKYMWMRLHLGTPNTQH